MPANMTLRRTLLALCSVSWLACGGGATGDGSTGGPSVQVPTDNVASFDRLQTELFTPSCATANCHVGSSAQAGLILTPDAAYANLVGVAPTNTNAISDGMRRVMAGKPDSSLLYRKLVMAAGFNAHDYGNPMPTGTAGVSIGQLEFVRQWIAAGAPKTGVVADAALLTNKSLQTTPPFAPLAAPAAGAGFQLKVNQFDVSANFERELFEYRKVNNTTDVYVNRIETSMRPYSHHFVLYTFDPNTPSFFMPQNDVVRDIRAADGSMIALNMIAMGYHVFFAGSMTQQSNYVFPAGTALKMPANFSIDLNVHYANHTDNQIPGEAYVNLYTVPAAQVVHPLSTLNLANTNLSLPAGKVTTVTKDFTFSATTTVTALTSHMHARGTKFQIRIVGGTRDGELVYENTDWEHPQIQSYTTPIVLQKGQGLRSVVTYNNTTSSTINFGLTSDQEMDIIFGYYY
ncbi:MAG: hypothetical protein JWM95_4030 [Gemmatimonadetes bacterium]|nr:hypothetical protein [Gemmatimonadota bacterium]